MLEGMKQHAYSENGQIDVMHAVVRTMIEEALD